MTERIMRRHAPAIGDTRSLIGDAVFDAHSASNTVCFDPSAAA
jgi:hypothetical protein